jgi:hypothetical protein
VLALGAIRFVGWLVVCAELRTLTEIKALRLGKRYQGHHRTALRIYSGCSRVQSCLFWVLDHGSGWTGVPHFMAGGFGWYPAVGSKYNRRSIVVDRPHLVWTTSKSMGVITASLATLRNMNIFLQITISSSSRVPCISVAAAMKTRIGDRKAKSVSTWDMTCGLPMILTCSLDVSESGYPTDRELVATGACSVQWDQKGGLKREWSDGETRNRADT